MVGIVSYGGYIPRLRLNRGAVYTANAWMAPGLIGSANGQRSMANWDEDNADGKVPCQIDGGLKCFGHPIGASGLRMLYEMYLQLRGNAADRQFKDPKIGLTHNLGGFPASNVNAIAIVGQL